MQLREIVRRGRLAAICGALVCSLLGTGSPATADEILITAGVANGPASAIEQSSDLIRTLMHEQLVPGLSVAVWRDKMQWSAGFGFSDLETRVPVTTRTRFRIGSISKPLTMAALAKLYEQGRVDFDVPVGQYVSYWPSKSHAITARQLAGHLAGIRHYVRNEFHLQRSFPTVRDGIEIFGNDPLLDPPGEKYRYSSYGYNLLSAVVEGAAEEPFLPFIQREVFDALGMHETVADRPEEIIPRRTRFYQQRQGELFNAPFVDNSYKWAGGGFLSTPSDLIRFATAHLSDQFLKPETVAMLWTSQHTNNGRRTGYGMGWSVALDAEGRKMVGHGGGSVGGSCKLLVFPTERLIIAVTSNLSSVRYNDLPERIATKFLEP